MNQPRSQAWHDDAVTDRMTFAQALKPHVHALLQAAGLDVSYVRAEGDKLYYRDDAGGEHEVLDLIGGFGATLLGHNHPELVACAQAALAAKRPFAAQASVRGAAGRLAERLNHEIGRITGRAYVVTLANSGTEAVEAAIKHAHFERSERFAKQRARIERRVHQIRHALRAGRAHIPAAVSAEVSRHLNTPIADDESLLNAVLARATALTDLPPRFWAVERAFHGKSTGSLTLTFNASFRTPFAGLGPNVEFLPPEDLDAVTRAVEAARFAVVELSLIGETVQAELSPVVDVAGCFVEPIQGEGGVHVLSDAYLRALAEAARACHIPLIIDEIQCGLGRCGTLLASAPSGVVGDYYLFSKALGGGLAKVSAVAIDRERFIDEFSYLHSSTFADDDFSSQIALRTLELLMADDNRLMRRAAEQGDKLRSALVALQARYPEQIRAVRGRGLLLGIELSPSAKTRSALLRVLGEQNLLCFAVAGFLLHELGIRVAPTLSAQATIRIEPSALISDADLSRCVHAFERVCEVLAKDDARALCLAWTGKGNSKAPARSTRDKTESARRSVPQTATKVGFLVHFLQATDLREWDPCLASLDDAQCRRLLTRSAKLLEPFVVDRIPVSSTTGDTVELVVIGLAFTAEQAMQCLRTGEPWIHDKIERSVDLARSLGCSVLGFGAYTSILTDNCRSIVADDIALTSGNSLTAACGLEALRVVAEGSHLEGSRLAIVGAAGNIGESIAEVAAASFRELVLVGRPASIHRLERLAERLRQKHPGVRVDVANDLAALERCQLILSATNAPQPIIDASHIGSDPVIICDIATPRDVDPTLAEKRPNARVIAGGLLRAPLGQSPTLAAMPLADGEVYACMAETLLLGLSGIREHFSRGPLNPERVRLIGELAQRHGFTVQPRVSSAGHHAGHSTARDEQSSHAPS